MMSSFMDSILLWKKLLSAILSKVRIDAAREGGTEGRRDGGTDGGTDGGKGWSAEVKPVSGEMDRRWRWTMGDVDGRIR